MDVSTRIVYESATLPNKGLVLAEANDIASRITQTDIDSLNKVLAIFDSEPKTDVVTASKSALMSLAEQNRQQGKLNELNSGEYRFRLTGVFKQQQMFAVVKKNNLLNEQQELISINVGSKLADYRVTEIGDTQVKIEAEDGRTILLMLFTANTLAKTT